MPTVPDDDDAVTIPTPTRLTSSSPSLPCHRHDNDDTTTPVPDHERLRHGLVLGPTTMTMTDDNRRSGRIMLR